MNTSLPCPECGKPLPAGSDHCPACLMAQAMASRTLDADSRQAVPPPEPAEIADKFPQLEILECLGRGGMGVVYKARQKSLNRLVAIKILAPERERDARFAERFAREAELLAKLSHPHIVTIHDFGETGGLYYLVMEFINGVNVRDLLRDGKMPPEQALAIVPSICEALQFAHDHGIVHRDIKPENLLLDREGRVKIADFGIATLAGDATDHSGTPAYMAPEQAGHAGKIDHRSDIYALGVVFYEMLTGERPTTSPVAPSKRVKIDVRLDEVVLRALDAQPERRYQTAEDFRTVVETVAQGNPPVPRGEWQLRCTTCNSTRSLASAGGIRIGAASIGKRTLAWCLHCGGLRFAAVEQSEGDTPQGIGAKNAPPAPAGRGHGIADEPPITWQRILELAVWASLSLLIVMTALWSFPSFQPGDELEGVAMVALATGLVTFALMSLTAILGAGVRYLWGKPTPAEPRTSHGWQGLLLHFSPALLLAAAWLTSGLEKGAVLILSVLVIAVMILRSLRQ